MSKLILVSCAYCGEGFKRSLKHINQNKRRGSKNYCSTKHQHLAYMGYKHTDKTKKLISLNHVDISGKNNPMYDMHRYGKDAPNYGKKHSKKTRKNMSIVAFKRFDNKHLTNKNILERNSLKNKQFIKDVLERENYTCQICNRKGGYLEVDHIMPWSLYPKLRYEPENTRTLCKLCHLEYGANPAHNKWATFPNKFYAKK